MRLVCTCNLQFSSEISHHDGPPAEYAGRWESIQDKLRHAVNMGEIFFVTCESSTKPDTTTTAKSKRECPIHRLLSNNLADTAPIDQCSSEAAGQTLFFSLGVFCSLLVASIYSQDPIVRCKAHGIVSKACRCNRAWDASLSIHIAQHLTRAEEVKVWEEIQWYEAGLDWNVLPQDAGYSSEIGRLIALLRSFSDL